MTIASLERTETFRRHRLLCESGIYIQRSKAAEDPGSICVSHHHVAFPDFTLKKPAPCSCFTLNLRVGGAKVWRTDRKCDGHVGRPGWSAMLPPYEESAWRSDGIVESLDFYVASEVVARLAREVFDVDIDDVSFQAAQYGIDTVAMRFGHTALERLESAEPIDTIELNAWAQLVGLHILRRYSDLSRRRPEPPPPRALPASDLETVVDYVIAHMDEALRLCDLAALVGMPERRFSQAFRVATGMTVHEYILHLRVDRARDLLQRSRLSLADIAALTGFASQSHMTTVFRRKLGVTPSRFRAG